MKRLKTLSTDCFGTDTPKELIPLVEKYHNRLDILAKEFVEDCIEENIDYNSAYGFILSRLMCQLTIHYCKSTLKNSRESK